MPLVPFTKPPCSPSHLVGLMLARGLVIPDRPRAERHIQTVGYYRLMGYGKHFFDAAAQRFAPGTHYEHIWAAYKFDRKLRLLTLDAIERIEVAVRAAMSNVMCMAHGAHWFMDASVFTAPDDAKDFCAALAAELKSKKNEITKHYYGKYSTPQLPPSWMVMECISMGAWVKILGKLKQAEQKRIASALGINHVSLVSWAASLSWTRNVCAHHGVLWNRIIMRPPKTPLPAMAYPSIAGKESSYFATAVITYGLLQRIVARSTWARRLEGLLTEFPLVDAAAMGFATGWERDPFWA